MSLERLHPGLQRWVRLEARWKGLSPIQQAAIEPILAGHDCVLEAPTAGGKTEAVLFPVLTRAAAEGGPAGSVRVLYLAPLRALLNNLEGRGERYASLCGLRAFKWHGDVGQKEKLEALRDPPHLLMTTPESLEAILLRKAGWRELFAGLRTVVIDEAHNFAAGDRGGHLLSLLERLGEATPEPPQRLALSATIGEPEAMLRWLAGGRRRPGTRVATTAGRRPERDFQVRFYVDEAGDQLRPEQQATYRRFLDLRRLVSGEGQAIRSRTLVFVGSRRRAESIAKAFKKSDEGQPLAGRLRVNTHHSAVSKFFREEAERLIQDVSEDGLHAIVSTSTLELGIDIGELTQVVQVDALSSPSSFLQRVGRTGRRPGRPQLFRGLVTEADDLLLLTATVSLAWQGCSEALHLPRRAFHLLAHQLLCLSLQELGVEPERAWRLLSAAHCFSRIERLEFDELVAHMVAKDYLRRVDGALLVGEAAEGPFLSANWRRLFAVFDSAPLYDVFHGRHHVGTLDAGFVEGRLSPFFFVLGGRLWQADRVDARRRIVSVHPASEGHPPNWVCFGGLDVPFETAQEAGRLLHEESLPGFLDEEAARVFRHLQHSSANDGWRPGGLVCAVSMSGVAQLTTFAGDRINRTLARLLAAAGLGKVTANFREVEVKPPAGSGRKTMERALGSFLAELRRGRRPEELALTLCEYQRPGHFSPFSPCLPAHLAAAALVDRHYDPAGLLALL